MPLLKTKDLQVRYPLNCESRANVKVFGEMIMACVSVGTTPTRAYSLLLV